MSAFFFLTLNCCLSENVVSYHFLSIMPFLEVKILRQEYWHAKY
jgi:hypothetical protein